MGQAVQGGRGIITGWGLFLNDKEVATGKLKDVKDSILYTGEIEGKTKQQFKYYVWVTSDVEKESIYE